MKIEIKNLKDKEEREITENKFIGIIKIKREDINGNINLIIEFPQIEENINTFSKELTKRLYKQEINKILEFLSQSKNFFERLKKEAEGQLKYYEIYLKD